MLSVHLIILGLLNQSPPTIVEMRDVASDIYVFASYQSTGLSGPATSPAGFDYPIFEATRLEQLKGQTVSKRIRFRGDTHWLDFVRPLRPLKADEVAVVFVCDKAPLPIAHRLTCPFGVLVIDHAEYEDFKTWLLSLSVNSNGAVDQDRLASGFHRPFIRSLALSVLKDARLSESASRKLCASLKANQIETEHLLRALRALDSADLECRLVFARTFEKAVRPESTEERLSLRSRVLTLVEFERLSGLKHQPHAVTENTESDVERMWGSRTFCVYRPGKRMPNSGSIRRFADAA